MVLVELRRYGKVPTLMKKSNFKKSPLALLETLMNARDAPITNLSSITPPLVQPIPDALTVQSVLFALILRMDPLTATCSPSQAQLMLDTKIRSNNTIVRVLRVLAALDLIQYHRPLTGSCKFRNHYKINVQLLADVAAHSRESLQESIPDFRKFDSELEKSEGVDVVEPAGGPVAPVATPAVKTMRDAGWVIALSCKAECQRRGLDKDYFKYFSSDKVAIKSWKHFANFVQTHLSKLTKSGVQPEWIIQECSQVDWLHLVGREDIGAYSAARIANKVREWFLEGAVEEEYLANADDSANYQDGESYADEQEWNSML